MPRGRNWVMGEQLAQVDNRDPFAVPVWRSPVYRTPEPVIMVVQLIRLIWRVLWFALTHPGADAVAALKAVFDFCDPIYAAMTDADAAKMVKVFGRDRTKFGALNFGVIHTNEMYGTLAVYLRAKDMVPPSSAGRGNMGRKKE